MTENPFVVSLSNHERVRPSTGSGRTETLLSAIMSFSHRVKKTVLFKRLVLFFLITLLAGAAAFGGLLLWVMTPSCARVVSERVSKEVAKQVPGTRVVVEKVYLVPHFTVALEPVRWSSAGGPDILVLDRVLVKISPRALLKKRLVWAAEGKIEKLDLSALDKAVGKGQWRALGMVSGPVRLEGDGNLLKAVYLKCEAQPGGGTLSGEIVQNLIAMMPADDARSALLKAIQSKPLFHFSVGKFEVDTEGGRYLIGLYLDGDHLLDIKIRVDKDSVGALETVLGGLLS